MFGGNPFYILMLALGMYDEPVPEQSPYEPNAVSGLTRGQVGPVCYEHAFATAIRPWLPPFASTDHGELRDALFEDHREDLVRLENRDDQSIILTQIAMKHDLQYRVITNDHAATVNALLDAKIPVVIAVTRTGMSKLPGVGESGAHAMVIDSFNTSTREYIIKNSWTELPWLFIEENQLEDMVEHDLVEFYFFWPMANDQTMAPCDGNMYSLRDSALQNIGLIERMRAHSFVITRFERTFAIKIRPWVPQFARMKYDDLTDALFGPHRKQLAEDDSLRNQEITMAKIAGKYHLQFRRIIVRHISTVKKLLDARS